MSTAPDPADQTLALALMISELTDELEERGVLDRKSYLARLEKISGYMKDREALADTSVAMKYYVDLLQRAGD